MESKVIRAGRIVLFAATFSGVEYGLESVTGKKSALNFVSAGVVTTAVFGAAAGHLRVAVMLGGVLGFILAPAHMWMTTQGVHILKDAGDSYVDYATRRQAGESAADIARDSDMQKATRAAKDSLMSPPDVADATPSAGPSGPSGTESKAPESEE